MSGIQSRAKFRRKDGALESPIAAPPPLPYSGDYEPPVSSSGSKISPAVLIIIIVLAAVFFISGLVHLLVRYFVKRRPSSDSEANDRFDQGSGSDAFQRQLQQLFHLHDSGLDQAFIDALPVFLYKEIVGLNEPFDCPVCLCEFSEQDKLRLLPLCSHAFHIDCIDTWLLSNSTCPLCRGSLYSPGIGFENPVFDFEDQEEGDVQVVGASRNGEGGNGICVTQRPAENSIMNQRRVFSVRLGKFRSSNLSLVESGAAGGGGGETNCCSSNTTATTTTATSSNIDARRCFSMGSYQYVVSDLELQVALRCNRGSGNGGGGGGGSSTRNLNPRAGQNGKPVNEGDAEGKRISIASKGESYSVSKIWLWSKSKTPTAYPNNSSGNNVPVHTGFPLKDRTQNPIT